MCSFYDNVQALPRISEYEMASYLREVSQVSHEQECTHYPAKVTRLHNCNEPELSFDQSFDQWRRNLRLPFKLSFA